MVHRSAGAGCVALTVLGALVLAGPPAAVAAEPPVPTTATSAAETLGAHQPSADVLRALRRDLGLTEAQARTRLVNEAEAGTRAGRLQNALGERFAGAWLHGATSADLTVATTDVADVPVIEAGGAKAAVAKNALAELRAVRAKLDAAARPDGLGTPVRYVDIRANRVTVQATSRSAGNALVAASGVDRKLVRVKVSANRPHALYDIRGGDAFHNLDEQARCSVGFSVTSGQEQGFATAGHCGRPGNRTAGYNRVDQGTFRASTFPGRDMAWVRVNNDWTATPNIKAAGGNNLQINGSVQALVGAAVCRSGSTSGWRCGRIEQHDTSVSYDEGTIHGVTETTVCAESGDSGGPVVASTQAQGVLSGGSGDCTTGGTTYYQPINPLLQAYGLVLTTSTSGTAAPGGAPQEPAGGTWAPGQVYGVGSTVTYGGVTYECLQAHQAQTPWQPAGTPALWQRR
ncbi:trypsin-like serine protease [Streptomyces sp. NBC_00286]|uniref:trypsin-like serine protease n=1 Tax=Streptomyces sp. NBC_00286 TaxID=2975701 RepID=UPI002E2ABA77|nr:trypsin-like serine protease [Streptomyces sp. NBC_00286]